MQKKEQSKSRWVIQSFCLTFVLSLIMSYITTNGISNLSIIPAILILIVVIFIGIITDIIGVAVTVADEAEFHAKASKKIRLKNINKANKKCINSSKYLCRRNRRCMWRFKWSNKCNDYSKTNTETGGYQQAYNF